MIALMRKYFITGLLVLVPLAIWIYALVFAFTSLWFTHYSLGALEKLRESTETVVAGASVPVPLAPDVASADASHTTLPPTGPT